MTETNGLPLRPIFARVLLTREKVEQIGTIFLPQSAVSKFSPTEGTIIAVGSTCDDSVKELLGKKVLFAKYAGDWIKVNDKEYFICQDEDILGEKL